MSNTTFPTSIDSPLTDPQTTDTLASVPHHLQHGFANDAIIALEQKLGSSASGNSPVANSMLVGTGSGTSQWQTTLTSFSITTSFLDTNGKTWIGQTATTNAVNYLNIANAATGNAVTLSVLGTDSNIDMNLVPKGSGKIRDNGSALIDFRSSFANYVMSGAVWTQNSGLVGSMTAGVLWINGIEYSQALVSNHTFGTSVDTYIDYTVGTGITYTAVANGASSGFTLAANSIRLAKVVTNGSAITSVTQFGSDTVGNIYTPAGPGSTKLLQNPYKFSAYPSGNLTVTASTWTKIQLNTKAFDTGNNYDNTTNYQFTAPVNGYYMFAGKVGSGSMTDAQFISVGLNVGSFSSTPTYTGGNMAVGGATLGVVTVTELISLTAGQTVQLYGFTGQTNIQAGPGYTNLSGFLVSAT
jgi:hypothetical protein